MTTHAYLIDPWEKTISQVPCTDLKTMQHLVRGSIEVAWQGPSGDILFVNETGLLADDRAFFAFEGVLPPLCGCAILTGDEVNDDSGDLTNPIMTLDDFIRRVRFLTDEQVLAWANANSSVPAIEAFYEGGAGPSTLATVGDLYDSKPKGQ